MAGRKIAEAFIKVRPDTKGFLADAHGDVNKAGFGLGQTFSGAFSSAFSKIGALVAGYLAVGKAITTIKQSVGLARDLAETQSAVNVIFGKGAAAVNKFAENATTALGQTRNQALGAANTFATFGKSAGLSGTGLVNFSTKLVGLSADLASFKNTSPEEAITAIGAALRGESEPIRRYGILLDDATLRQRAMKMGITDTISKALTPQQRVLAAQAEIFAQTSDAQGDFARTSNGLANQQRITSATIAETKTKIGELLLPAVTAITVFFNTKFLPMLEGRLIPALGRLRDWFVNVVVPAIREHVIPVLQSLQQWFAERIVPNIENHVIPVLRTVGRVLVNNVVPALVATGRAIATFVGWLTGTSSAATALRWVIATVVAALIGYKVVMAAIAVAHAVQTALVWAHHAALVAVHIVTMIVRGAVIAWTVVQWLLNAALTANPIGIIIVAIGALVAAIIWVATKTRFFQTVWSAAWGWVKAAAKAVADWFTGSFWPGVQRIFNRFIEGVGNVRQRAIDNFTRVVDYIRSIPGRILSAIGNLKNLLINAGKDVITGLWNGITSMGAWLRDSLINWVRDHIPGPIAKILGLGSPSRLFAGYGRDTVRGFVQGFTRESADVAGRLARILPPPPPPAAAAAAGGGGGLRVENLTVKAFSDRFSLAQIQDELALHGVS